MSHLGDTNKMVETPRTNDQIGYDGSTMSAIRIEFARQLERELNEANDRIKRLEEALYKIEFYAATGILQDSFDEIKRIAKEAKL
jgi:hypothetical protein